MFSSLTVNINLIKMVKVNTLLFKHKHFKCTITLKFSILHVTTAALYLEIFIIVVNLIRINN